MTQIRSLTQPLSRRPGELGVHSLDHFNFSVPNAEDARRFYSTFGLDLREESGRLNLYTHGHPHRWGSIVEGPRKKLQFISFGAFEDDLPRFRERRDPLRGARTNRRFLAFGAFEDDLPRFRERLDALRVVRIDPPPGTQSNGLWFCDPDGTPIEIRVAEKSSPNEKPPHESTPSPPGVAGAPSCSTKPVVQPRRLAHI